MKKTLTTLGLAICLGYSIGCGGPPAVDTSDAVKQDSEDITKEIEEKMPEGYDQQYNK